MGAKTKMKQYITPTQLDKLSEKGKKKLRKWWKPKSGDWFITKYDSLWVLYGREEDNELVDTDPQLLTDQPVDSGYYGWAINQNFLLESDNLSAEKARDKQVRNEALPLLSIGQMIEFLEEYTKYEFHIFRRMVDWKVIYEDIHYGKILGGELCDALWEAIKEVLEK